MKTAVLATCGLPFLVGCLSPTDRTLIPNEAVTIRATEADGVTPLMRFRGARLDAPLSALPGLQYASGQGDVVAYTIPPTSPLRLRQGPGTVSLLFFRGRLMRIMVHTRTQAERRQLLAELSRAYGPPPAEADSSKVQIWSSRQLDVTYYPDDKQRSQADAWVLSPALAQQWEVVQGQAARAQQRKP